MMMVLKNCYSISLPNNILIFNKLDNNWGPIELVASDDKFIYLVDKNDLLNLFILDNNFVEDNINIKLGRISREIANSDQSSLFLQNL